MIGIRDLDPLERDRLKGSGITVYTMRDIDERGMGAITREALERLEHRERLHVSLDMDAIDPQVGPGVGTPSHGGLTYREAQLMMEIIADSNRCSSLDIVEINPIFDQHNQTAQLAVELTASLFGKRIL
jgi:arginase